MGIVKIMMNDKVLMDVTDATITASNLKEDSIAYGAEGNKVTGTVQEQADDYVTAVLLRSSDTRIQNFEWTLPSNSGIYLSGLDMVNNVTIYGGTNIPNNAGIGTGTTGVINLPDLKKINTSCWGTDSTNLKGIYAPNVTSIGANFFTSSNYPKLIKVVLGASPFTSVASTGSFRGTKVLKALVLKVSAVPTLAGTSAVSQSALTTDPNSYVYVPRALKDSFEEATNWSTLKFRAIEDYPLIDAPDIWVPAEEEEE